MLKWLREYIQNTPVYKIRQEWAEIEKIPFQGIKVYDYFDYLPYCNKAFIAPSPPKSNVAIPGEFNPELLVRDFLFMFVSWN